MARRDFVTTSDREEGAALKRDLSPTNGFFPGLGDQIRVVDLECVTNEMLAPLLAAGDDGECVVLLDGRPSRWYQGDKGRSGCEPRPGIADDWACCACCSRRISLGAYAVICKGSLMCRMCGTADCVAEITSRNYWPALFELVAENLPDEAWFEDRGST
jgi:hypothetical protein